MHVEHQTVSISLEEHDFPRMIFTNQNAIGHAEIREMIADAVASQDDNRKCPIEVTSSGLTPIRPTAIDTLVRVPPTGAK